MEEGGSGGGGGGGEPEHQEKTLNNELKKMPHTRDQIFKPQPRLDPYSSIGDRLGKQTCRL